MAESVLKLTFTRVIHLQHEGYVGLLYTLAPSTDDMHRLLNFRFPSITGLPEPTRFLSLKIGGGSNLLFEDEPEEMDPEMARTAREAMEKVRQAEGTVDMYAPKGPLIRPPDTNIDPLDGVTLTAQEWARVLDEEATAQAKEPSTDPKDSMTLLELLAAGHVDLARARVAEVQARERRAAARRAALASALGVDVAALQAAGPWPAGAAVYKTGLYNAGAAGTIYAKKKHRMTRVERRLQEVAEADRNRVFRVMDLASHLAQLDDEALGVDDDEDLDLLCEDWIDLRDQPLLVRPNKLELVFEVPLRISSTVPCRFDESQDWCKEYEPEMLVDIFSRTPHKRMTISIPAELAARLEPHKATLNMSSICAAALEHELAVRSAAVKTSEELQSTVARLRAGKLAPHDSARAQGLEKGARWAMEDATYQDFQWFVESNVGANNYRDTGQLRELGHWWLYRFKQESAPKTGQLLSHWKHAGEVEQFCAAFAEAVLDVWKRVSEAVEAK